MMTNRELLIQIRKFIISGGDTISMIAMIDRVLMMNAYTDDDRYLSESDRIKKSLIQLLGTANVPLGIAIVDKIEQLIKAVIEEDRYDRSPDRQDD